MDSFLRVQFFLFRELLLFRESIRQKLHRAKQVTLERVTSVDGIRSLVEHVEWVEMSRDNESFCFLENKTKA